MLEQLGLEQGTGLYMLVVAGLMGLVGSFLYRMRGAGEEEAPVWAKLRFVRRASVSVAIGLAAFLAGVPWEWAMLIAPVSYLGVVLGHGSYFPQFPNHKTHSNVDNEWSAFITRMISDPLDYKARRIGMALSGLALTLPVGAIIGVGA